MKTILLLMCALALGGCREKKSPDSNVVIPQREGTGAAIETPLKKQPEDDIQEIKRAAERSVAIADLISAHQKVSQDEDFAERYLEIMRGTTHQGDAAVTQNYLTEVQNDIRTEKRRIEDLENVVINLSRPGDPPYKMQIIQFLADLNEAKLAAMIAKHDKKETAGLLEKMVTNMHTASAEEVLSRTYARVKEQ